MKKKWIWGISGCVSLVAGLILTGVISYMSQKLPDQQEAVRWAPDGGAAQISCFFSCNEKVSPDRILEFEYSLDSYLKEASIELESENPGARLWADAYSADGRITLSSDRANLEADAIGIGGDFFLFHPEKLLYGAYFSGNDVNQDYCVIDEDAAWRLFGSNNVAGQLVYIGGSPHMVTGVIERREGRLEKAAGLDGTLVYVSYETLEQYGRNNGINHYEIVMPNPVSKFASSYVKERLATQEKETEVVENTTRFSLLNRIRFIQTFGVRSMNGKAIIYPYWENLARGYEEILGILTWISILTFVYPVLVFLTIFIRWWKHKSWTFKGIVRKIGEKRWDGRLAALGRKRLKRSEFMPEHHGDT